MRTLNSRWALHTLTLALCATSNLAAQTLAPAALLPGESYAPAARADAPSSVNVNPLTSTGAELLPPCDLSRLLRLAPFDFGQAFAANQCAVKVSVLADFRLSPLLREVLNQQTLEHLAERAEKYVKGLLPLDAVKLVEGRGMTAAERVDFQKKVVRYLSVVQLAALPTGQLEELIYTRAILEVPDSVLATIPFHFMAPESTRTKVLARVGKFMRGLIGRNVGQEELLAIDARHIGAMRPLELAAVDPESFQFLSVLQLGHLTEAQVEKLTEAQLEGLSPTQRNALPRAEFLRRRYAIKPGVSLLGEGYAQLAEGANGGGAFGAGIEVVEVTRHSMWRASIMVRRGSAPAVLTTAEQRGAFLLAPGSEKDYAGLDVRYLRDGPYAGYRGNEWSSLMSGGRIIGEVARATWQLEPNMQANTVCLSTTFGPTWHYTVAQGDNYIDLSLLLGYTVRKAVFDSATEDFQPRALGEGVSWFQGADIRAEFRINNVIVGAQMLALDEEVRGLSGAKFIPSITLRTGAQLVDFLK